jgi:hypothetical protein
MMQINLTFVIKYLNVFLILSLHYPIDKAMFMSQKIYF